MSEGRDTRTADGYRAPIHLALTKVMELGGAPRELLFALGAFCFGAAMIWHSWGPAVIYVAGHAAMAYASWRDPWWPHVIRERVRLGLVMFRRRHR
jgi:type IV secretory pathway TrbD component